MNVKSELLERFLDHIVEPNECVDTYGRTYIDDFGHIVVENHGFDVKTQKFKNQDTQEWFEKVCKSIQAVSMEGLIAYLKENADQIAMANIRPRQAPEAQYESYGPLHTLKTEGFSVKASNELQRQWSLAARDQLHTNDNDGDWYELYMSYDRVNPWSFLIRREVARGNLSAGDPVLCFGNRWLGEIFYFRDNLGLKNTRGVDLFSRDAALVLEADMHDLPLEDNSVKMIFARGAVNKSYDVRLLIKEMIRVLAKDGFVCIEQPVYRHGVDVHGPTDLKNCANLLGLFGGKVRRIIYADAYVEARVHRYNFDDVRLVKIFVQLDKDGSISSPSVERFPELRFKLYDTCRRFIVKRRLERRVGMPLTPHPNAKNRGTWSELKLVVYDRSAPGQLSFGE